MNLCPFECELLTEWLSEMVKNKDKYLEPVVDVQTTMFMKHVCNMLKQDIHVFVFSVDILEEYISRKSLRKQEIDDPALTLIATIFICSKFMGDQDVKIQYFQNVLTNITGHMYSPKSITLQELEILGVLDHSLPLNNKVDDLKTFVSKFEKESRIKVPVLKISCEVLELLYLTRINWFYSLKSLYTINDEALDVFKKLIQNRFFLPIGILVCVFKITSYENTLDVENILKDLAYGSEIHVDHLNALVSKIVDVIEHL